MEAALLILDAVGVVLVVLWVIRGRGSEGLFGWRPDPPDAAPAPPRRRG